MSAKNGSIAHVAEVKWRIDALPIGPDRTMLEIKFAATVTTLARKIRDATARRK
jgi:hypothetical protein